MSELQEYYSNIDNCRQDIMNARHAFGSVHTTEEQYEQMEKALGIMYLYCPEEIQGIVEATIDEAQMRKYHFITKIWVDK